jgi:hypothetical protein
MARLRTTPALLALVTGVVLVVGCSDSGSGAQPAGDPPASEPAIVVDGDEVTTRELVRELRILADNEQYARVLREQDDEKLVPREGTINPIVAAAWVNQRVNQAVVDREFERRSLVVTPAQRREAKRNAAELVRGRKVFDAFPRPFRAKLLRRQERIEALEATFPATAEPTEAELAELLARTRQTCEGDKLLAQILVEDRADADAIADALATGADFATLARERSEEPVTAANGGVFACIGAPRFRGSARSVQDAARALPIGATSDVLRIDGGYALIRALPFTLDHARPLLVETWRSRYGSPFGDFVREAVLDASLAVDPRFATASRGREFVGIGPLATPVRL